jgi:hypothetical protein
LTSTSSSPRRSAEYGSKFETTSSTAWLPGWRASKDPASRVSAVMFEVGENPILTTPVACLAAARASSRAAVSCA